MGNKPSRIKIRKYGFEWVTLLILFGIVLLIARAEAFGVTSVCSDRTPCYMHPGEEKSYDFLLQSGAGGDAKVRFELLDDAGGIAQIVGDNEFIVPAGSQNVNAKLKVKIPEDASVGIINVIVKFTEIPIDEGQVTLSPSFTMSFPVTVRNLLTAAPTLEDTTKPKTFFLIMAAILLVFIVSIIIVYMVLKHKKNSGI